MYNLGEILPGVSVEPGTNLLMAGPPMTGKRSLALRILAEGANSGDGTIVVTTKDSGDKILGDFQEYVDDFDSAPVGVVDCVTKQQGMRNSQASEHVAYASSPVDMTGIGIKLSEFLQHFYQDLSIQRNRILLYSLSTLLMYSNLQTVFRFLHVFTGRIQSADALGVFVIDSTAHDDQTMSTLKQLFDGEIQVREGDEHGTEIRVTGLPDVESEWRSV
jgi:KaiC/GvpD/RAD55 family RecA-like ATPase